MKICILRYSCFNTTLPVLDYWSWLSAGCSFKHSLVVFCAAEVAKWLLNALLYITTNLTFPNLELKGALRAKWFVECDMQANIDWDGGLVARASTLFFFCYFATRWLKLGMQSTLQHYSPTPEWAGPVQQGLNACSSLGHGPQNLYLALRWHKWWGIVFFHWPQSGPSEAWMTVNWPFTQKVWWPLVWGRRTDLCSPAGGAPNAPAEDLMPRGEKAAGIG